MSIKISLSFALLSASLSAPLLLSGCGSPDDMVPPSDEIDIEASGKRDAFDQGTDPSQLLQLVNNATLNADDLVPQGSVGTLVSVPRDSQPFSSTYWPMTKGGIAARWQGGNVLSPAEKFAKLYLNASQGSQMLDWIQKNHGKSVPGVQSWFGICQGWTASGIMEKAPQKPVTVKLVVRGLNKYLQYCSATEAMSASSGCVRFETGDLTGLLAESYSNADSRFIGYRCDTSTVNFSYDDSGRIQQPNCRSNAGTLFLTATNFIGKAKRAFAINAVNNDEVWNQPAFAYTISRYESVNETQAAQLVDPAKFTYDFNPDARGFRHVVMKLVWAVEATPTTSVPPVLSANKTYEMIVELDQSGNVIGGEWVGDQSKNDHPPFFWSPVAPGTQVPYLTYSYVKVLLNASRSQ